MKYILAAIACLVSVVGFWYFSTQTHSVDTSQTQTPAENVSWEDALKHGGDHRCDITMSVKGMQSTGTVYVSGVDMRGEFNSTMEGHSMKSSILRVGGFMYTWTNMYPQGFKAPVVDTQATDPIALVGGGVVAKENVKFPCTSWKRDEAQFVVPKDITFTTAPTR